MPSPELVKPPDRAALYEYFKKGSVGAELGVHAGKNAEVLLRVARPKRLYLVDPWTPGLDVADGVDPPLDGQEAYRQCAVRFRAKHHVGLRRMTSIDWLPSLRVYFLDWAYLDAAHDYESTRRELELLTRCVKRTGIIAGHDYHPHFPGVIQAVDELVARGEWRLAYLTAEEFWPSFGLVRAGRP